jgi:DNA-binding IclR family transcriptional regulator
MAPILVRELAQNRAVGPLGAPTSKGELERRLTGIRSAGLATVKEGDGGLSAVSAPVFDSNERLRPLGVWPLRALGYFAVWSGRYSD